MQQYLRRRTETTQESRVCSKGQQSQQRTSHLVVEPNGKGDYCWR